MPYAYILAMIICFLPPPPSSPRDTSDTEWSSGIYKCLTDPINSKSLPRAANKSRFDLIPLVPSLPWAWGSGMTLQKKGNQVVNNRSKRESKMTSTKHSESSRKTRCSSDRRQI